MRIRRHLELLHEPKIEQDDPPVGADDDVLRLHVTVHEPQAMGLPQSHRHLEHDAERLLPWNAPLPQELSHRAPADVLHDEVELPRVRLADVVNASHARGVDRATLRPRGEHAARSDLGCRGAL